MSRPPLIKIALGCALQRAGVDGLTIGELRVLFPRYSYGTVSGTLHLMREAGTVRTLRQSHVAVNFDATLPLDACRAAFVRRLGARAGEAHSAHQALRETQASPTDKRAKPPMAARLRREHQLANRAARAIKGDGTHQPPSPGPRPSAPPAGPALDGVPITRCPSWRPRFALTEPISSLPIGQYDTPPSPWAAAVCLTAHQPEAS